MYLADTALWVYLIHQPFVLIGLAWLAPYQMPWWALTAAVSEVFSVAGSLLLYPTDGAAHPLDLPVRARRARGWRFAVGPRGSTSRPFVRRMPVNIRSAVSHCARERKDMLDRVANASKTSAGTGR